MAPSIHPLVAFALLSGVDVNDRRRLRRRGTTTTTTTTILAASTPSDYLDAGGGAILDPNDIGPYVRIKKRGRHYDVQTAITTFRKQLDGRRLPGRDGDGDGEVKAAPPAMIVTVDLHAQIHFGDAAYYGHFDDDVAFGSKYDRVLYELIVEDRFLEPISSSSSSIASSAASTALYTTATSTTAGGAPILRRLTPATPSTGLGKGGKDNTNPIAPTRADRNTASQYRLQCQVDGIRYCRDGWVHADLTREEFLAWLDRRDEGGERERRRQQQRRQRRRPLWALASTSASYPGSEFVSSLLRPLTSDGSSAALTRRLFTHLFLPGDALSGWIRTILWLGVPSPELPIMLVDWSSLSHVGRRSRRRRRSSSSREGGTAHDDDYDDRGVAPVSPIAAPVLLSLLAGEWGAARRLVFGQVLASGQSSDMDASRNGVLIDRRNDRAMDVLRESLSSSSGRDGVGDPAGGDARNVALLYGAGHCRDLHRRLVDSEGMTPVRTEWRTAFRATAPRWGDLANVDDWMRARSKDVVSSLPSSMDMGDVVESMSASTLESVAVGLVILPLYMVVGGFDWVSTIGDAEISLRGGMYLDGIATVLLYLVRHVAMYVGISKFVVDWGGNGDGIFDDDESA